MPMPKPTKDETHDEFMSRCMADSTMKSEYGNPKQRVAVCMRQHKGHTFKKASVETVKADKPGPNDPRRTPAEPSERKKGSKKNKPGSAKKPNKSITFSKETNSRLSALVTKHNKGKGPKVTLGMLKSVYRRGAGAFSNTHAPKMSRGGWAMARVKAFLRLVRSGRPSNPNYTQDNDLLPKGHSRAGKSKKKASVDDIMSEWIGYAEYADPDNDDFDAFDHPPNFNEQYEDWGDEQSEDVEIISAAEGKKKNVKLGKPFRTPGGPKKFGVYVKNDKGNVIMVRFGDPNMEIKRDDPARRKNFRSRHNCDNPGPRTKARYWSCRMWSSRPVNKITSQEECGCGGDC